MNEADMKRMRKQQLNHKYGMEKVGMYDVKTKPTLYGLNYYYRTPKGHYYMKNDAIKRRISKAQYDAV